VDARVTRAIAILMIVAAAMGEVRAQDDVVHGAYASIENAIRREFDAAMAGLARDAAVRPPDEIENATELLKFISYNKAVMFAYCFAETRKDHPPARNSRVRSENNLILTTCVESRFGELRKFTSLKAYVGTFFQERISACEERARLAEREKVLPPYAFLGLEKPRLYDFSEYNRCLAASD
jgi:hypothetical protein